MKKVFALMIVLALVAIPAVAFAGTTTVTGKDVLGHVGDAQDSFFMPEDNLPPVVEGGVELPPVVVIPAAGPMAVAGVAAVLATLGCALLPKKD